MTTTEMTKIETIVSENLYRIGVPVNCRGYQYLRHAICMCIDEPAAINAVTKILYPKIATIYKTTSSRVESAIRHAIIRTWSRGNMDVLNSYFGSTINSERGKPTNSEFIAMISDKIRLELSDDDYVQESHLQESQRDLEIIVTERLKDIGIPAHIKGYNYLRYAIIKCIDEPVLIDNVRGKLYPLVAKTFNTNISAVNRAVYHAIEVAWERGNLDVLYDYFGYTIRQDRGKPTNSEFIAMISDKIRLELSYDEAYSSTSIQESQRDLEIIVTERLKDIGVPAHLKGYNYLRSSMLICIDEPAAINAVTKILYPKIAKEYATTSSRVERTIRHAIEVAWDRGDVDVLNSYFGYTIRQDRGKPTNTEFIAILSDQIRLDLKRLKCES